MEHFTVFLRWAWPAGPSRHKPFKRVKKNYTFAETRDQFALDPERGKIDAKVLTILTLFSRCASFSQSARFQERNELFKKFDRVSE